MTAVWILIVIFIFIIIEEKETTKRKKMKIEAMLKEEELKRGYKPGTYSNLDDGKSFSLDEERGPNHMSKDELKRGLNDLDKRLKNLDTILKNRKNED